MRIRMTMMVAVGLALAGCADASKPGSQDRERLAGGYDQFSIKQYGAAEAAASSYVQKFPDGANVDEAYYLRGISRAGRNQNAAAASDLRMAIQTSKRNDLKAKAFHTLGDMAYEGQRWSEARPYYQQALTFYGVPDAMSTYRIGACYQAEGKWSEGKPYFEKVAGMTLSGKDAGLADRARVRAAAMGFNLQFGAYRDAATAQKAVGVLKMSGINSTVIPGRRDGVAIYYVRAGIFRTMADAETAKVSALKAYPGTIIVP